MSRGGTMQILSSWLPARIVPIVPLFAQAVLFALPHLYADPIVMCALSFSGLVMGYVTIKTGGLECSIAMHVANNLASSGMAIMFAAPDSGTSYILAFLVPAFLGLVALWTAKRKGMILK